MNVSDAQVDAVYPQWLRLEVARERYGDIITDDWLQAMRINGRLRTVAIGGTERFLAEDIETVLAQLMEYRILFLNAERHQRKVLNLGR